MKRIFMLILSFIAIMALAIPGMASDTVWPPPPGGVTWESWPYYSSIYPYFFIEEVEADQSVTIHAYNFPANDTFSVTMGLYGTLGVGGINVGSTDTGSGGSFIATYDIPESLAGKEKIAIRLQSPSSGYYAYNWFWNNTSTSQVQPAPNTGYKCCPYFLIDSVVKDTSVTIKAYNFPTNDSFVVTMGLYGSYGIGGYVIATTTTTENGDFTATYQIPDKLEGSYRIAIRLESTSTGYYGYNWFYNNSTSP